MQPDPSVRKVLIYRLGSLGDTVVALPGFHLVARVFPRAERRLLTNFPVHAKAPPAAAVLGESGLVHNYLRYAAGTRNPAELLRLTWQIRRFNPDLLVYLQPSRGDKAVRRDAAFFRMSGIGEIVGLPLGDLGVSTFDPATGLWEREASRLMRCLRPLGEADVSDLRNWDLHLTEAEHRKAGEALAPCGDRPIIACGPGTKMQAKDWGQENWRGLLGRLSKKYPWYGLVLSGAKDDAAVCDYAALDWAGPKLNLAGLNPRESAAVFSRARIFIGPDSGPQHLAASVGTPCACVFSARNLPGVWFPPGNNNVVVYHKTECFGCGLETCIEMEQKCIRSVTVDEMERAADRILGGSPAAFQVNSARIS